MGLMEPWIWAALGAAFVLGVVRPLLWWVLLSLSLWIGRKVLSDRVGRMVFEHYWDGRSPRYLSRKRSTGVVASGTEADCANNPALPDASGLAKRPLDK